LQVLYSTCAVDGCDIPSHLAEIDHLTSWEAGGTTDLDNLIPLCPPHNKFKYRHPDRVRIRDNPDGTKILTILPPWRSPRATAWRTRTTHNRP
ncbi:MAG TPA: HNH endonuclease signature motif containing protein, partial [Thermopolyspora sp.]